MSVDITRPQAIGGFISAFIFGVLWLVSTFRLLVAALGYNDKSHRFFLHKLIFHAVYSLYTMLELLYAVSLIIYEEIVVWGYTLHVVALFLNLGLFLMLIHVWGIILQDVQKTRAAAMALILINFAAIIWAIADMHHTQDMADFLDSSAYLTLVCANAFAKFSLCILIIMYGHDLQETLQVTQDIQDVMTAEEISIKLMLLQRIKIVLRVSLLKGE